MWMIFSSSLMNLCISIKIMYEETTMTLRSWLIDWHWQMWVWSQVNQVFKVHSESWKEHTNEPSEDEDNHELTSL